MSNKKHKQGKPPISLIPSEAIIEEAKAFEYGAGKHGRYSFRDGIVYVDLIDAAFRHLLALSKGEDIDEESGCLHAAMVRTNMAMLIYQMEYHPEMDDRYKAKAVDTKEFPKKLTDKELADLEQDFSTFVMPGYDLPSVKRIYDKVMAGSKKDE